MVQFPDKRWVAPARAVSPNQTNSNNTRHMDRRLVVCPTTEVHTAQVTFHQGAPVREAEYLLVPTTLLVLGRVEWVVLPVLPEDQVGLVVAEVLDSRRMVPAPVYLHEVAPAARWEVPPRTQPCCR